MKKQQVLNCSFSSWYQLFKQITIESKIISLPKEFIDYLNEDGIVLPEGDHSRNDEADDEQEENDEQRQVPSFPDLQQSIHNALHSLGGAVFPKLNWSCPKDASWIACGNTLKCHTPNDIILLLKSSDFVTHDVTCPFDSCEDDETASDEVQFELILRKWVDVSQAMEFRVFVKHDNIIGISQRDPTTYFPVLQSMKEHIGGRICNFHRKYIQGKFHDEDYVFDVYFKNEVKKIMLLDFNPFGEVTDGLMFEWSELCGEELQLEDGDAAEDDTPDLTDLVRIVESGTSVQPSPYNSYRVPTDVIDIATGMDSNKLIDFLQLEARQQGNEETETNNEENR
ncbi:translation initiation factor eIF2 assembly protein-like [Amphiura filiformis]|uniref:translation initiation factor eIF2 assembly protein-like n=1 Tax=Amphiura filiformis TaxID=82378 RepID=UPI003B20FB63